MLDLKLFWQEKGVRPVRRAAGEAELVRLRLRGTGGIS